MLRGLGGLRDLLAGERDSLKFEQILMWLRLVGYERQPGSILRLDGDSGKRCAGTGP
jgi:hypothetical protein